MFKTKSIMGVTLKINKKELEMGIKIESEHSKSRKVQKKIAMDHLSEDPKYYSKYKKCFKHK